MTTASRSGYVDVTATNVITSGLVVKSTTAGAITAATTLTPADSGGVFSISQAATYDVNLPVASQGLHFTFYLTGPANFAPTITVAGSASTFVGTIINDVTSVIPATGATLTFVGNVAALGDIIEVWGVSATLYLVRAACTANGGITIA